MTDTSNDDLSEGNLCTTDIANLKEIKIVELKYDLIEVDTILWVKTVYDPCSMATLMLIVEDKDGTTLSLALHNQIKKNFVLVLDDNAWK